MTDKKIQAKNDLNIFLNEYFSLIVFVIAIFILVLSYIFLISPKLRITKNAISNNITAQRQLYAQQENKLNELKIINSVYAKILPADLDKFNKVLPSEYVKETLYGEMEEIVTREGFILSSVTITGDEEEAKGTKRGATEDEDKVVLDPSIAKTNFTLEIESIDYRGLKKIINNLEASSRLFDIETLSFSQEDLSASLTVTTYYYQEKSLK